jgi:CheY-like chemotaxis protein
MTTGHTILLADENDATRAFLAANLSADGYRVMAAEDRVKAIALLSVYQPDLIVADVNDERSISWTPSAPVTDSQATSTPTRR